jgi:glycosyltransferase involved in cell wall biosynthesis
VKEKKMNQKKTILQILEKKDNNYSFYEPFEDGSPISSSIIIPVYNGKRCLEKTLESLSKNKTILANPGLFELIVVNDGSEEDVYQTFKKIFFSCDKIFINNHKNFGRSAARNSGIKESNNNLLFFFDGDIIIPPNYFERTWAIHNSLDKAVVVGLAQNKFFDEFSGKYNYSEDIIPDITDDFRYYKKFKNVKFGEKEFRLIEETDWFKNFGYHKRIGPWELPKMVVTHNLSVRRKQVLGVGGFDEKFKTWGYEDTHFGAKLIAKDCYVIPLTQTGVIRILERDKKRRFSYENKKLYEKLIDSPPDF